MVTLFLIAQELNIPLNDLIEANYFLPDPTLVFPGEQICIPFIVPKACCLVLELVVKHNYNFRGVSLIEPINNGGRITVAAVDLPAPTVFGDFDTYLASLVFREIERLIPLKRVTIPQQPFLWTKVRTIEVPPLAANLIVVFPFNTKTEDRGPDILRSLVINCKNIKK